MEKQNTTDRLMNVLHRTDSSVDLADYLSKGQADYSGLSFHNYFFSLEKVRAVKHADLIRLSGIERTYFYQLLSGRRHPGRDKIIALGLAAQIDLKDLQRGLKIASYAPLYSRDKRDAVLIFSVEHQLSVMDTNELLDQFHEPVLN